VVLAGIVFVLKSGIPWDYFPRELGCVGRTLRHRLRDWQQAGVWEWLQHTLMQHLSDADKIDWGRAAAGPSRPRGRFSP
jgi:transposase